MPIRPTFSNSDLDRKVSAIFDRANKSFEARLIKRFQYLGELCVKHARENGTYTDQTGNLRASIGYVIYQDGKTVDESFDAGISNEAYQSTREFHQKIGRELPKGIFLLVVAGMNYALKVESKGYNVITSAEILAEREAPKMIIGLLSNTRDVIIDAIRNIKP